MPDTTRPPTITYNDMHALMTRWTDAGGGPLTAAEVVDQAPATESDHG
jgi:hypothetical protein